ncbi:LysR family transcriptional regulator [Pseudorhodoferax sp.]|uniref:LysR family transcriptional regulator n=1 Tax=Pseudorhodoferax sp. TaxID=1993553 RepID=UPI0039E56C7B
MPAPELLHLRALAAVAEWRSYRRAARALNVSPSALSQAVRTLEQAVGVPLLQRTTRSVAPTEAGAHLLAELCPLLAGLDAALADVGAFRAEVRGTLRLNVPRSACSLWLAPLLADFLRAHPGIHLEVASQDGLVDIVQAGFDAGVRFPEQLPRGMVALPLGPRQRFVVVASPAVAARGRPAVPQELAGLPCVRQRFPSGSLLRWEFRRGEQACAIEVDGPLTVDDQRLALRAALDGVGWAYLYEAMAAPALAGGRLVSVLDDWRPDEPGFALYYPGRRQVSPALRAFLDWLAARDGALLGSRA